MSRRPQLPGGIQHAVQQQADRLLMTGRRFSRFDQIRQRHFWSTFFFDPDANGYISTGVKPLFTTPPGQTGQGFPFPLTERDTNWKSANRVPDNQNFEVLEVGVSIGVTPRFPTADDQSDNELVQTGAIVSAIADNCVVEIQYLTNAVPLGLIGDFPQSSGPRAGQDQATTLMTNPRERWNLNGLAAPGLRRRFKVPIMLQHGETFSFRFNVPRSFFVGTGTTLNQWGVYGRLDFWATESFAEKS